MHSARTNQHQKHPDAKSLAAALCAALESMLSDHKAMIAVVKRRKEALRRARIADLNACVAEESVIAQRIAGLDQRREAASLGLVTVFGGVPAGSPRGWRPNAEWLAPRVGGEAGERLLSLAVALRAVITELRTENASTREAAEHVARHIQGIVRSVEQRLSGSGAYTPRGVVNAAPSALCGVDITS